MAFRAAGRFAAAILALLISACASGPTSPGASGPSSGPSAPLFGYPAAGWDERPEGRQWTTLAHQAIDTLAPQLVSVVPADIDAFCPGYRNASPANRRAFYVALLAEVARYESNFDPSVRYTESFKDSQGRPVVSRGLLQISQESANGYGCAIATADQLQDPATNIQCGVRILDRWIRQDQLVTGYVSGSWRGASRYWAVLRDRNKLVDMQAALNARPHCARRNS